MATLHASPYRTGPLPRAPAHDDSVSLSVVARWGDEVLAVEHLARGERFVLAPTMTRDPFALAHPSVEVALVGAEHRADGACYAHGHADPLVGDAPALVTIGVITLDVRRVWMPAPLAQPRSDPDLWRALACVTALVVMAWVAVAVAAREDAWITRVAREDARIETLRALVARWPDAASTTRPAPEPSTWSVRWHRHGCAARRVTCCFGPCAPFPYAEVCDELAQQREHTPSWGGVAPPRKPPAPNVSCKVRYGDAWAALPSDMAGTEHPLYLETLPQYRRALGPSLRWWRRRTTLDFSWRPSADHPYAVVRLLLPGARGVRARDLTQVRCRYWDLPPRDARHPAGTSSDHPR